MNWWDEFLPSFLSRGNYRFRYSASSLVPKRIPSVHESQHEIARHHAAGSLHIHRYVYLRVVPRNLLFTNSMFEEWRGVTSTYDFMTARSGAPATRISAPMGPEHVGLLCDRSHKYVSVTWNYVPSREISNVTMLFDGPDAISIW